PAGRLASQLGGVVDLAVADHPDGSVRTLERLIAGGEIHDGEAAGADAGPVMSDDALAVGAPMRERRRHGGGMVRMAERAPGERHHSEDAAHLLGAGASAGPAGTVGDEAGVFGQEWEPAMEGLPDVPIARTRNEDGRHGTARQEIAPGVGVEEG